MEHLAFSVLVIIVGMAIFGLTFGFVGLIFELLQGSQAEAGAQQGEAEMITLGQELKAMILDNLVLLLITVIAFTGVFLFFQHEYRHEYQVGMKTELRARYFILPPDIRNEIMREYGFTDDDVNPSKLLRELTELPK